MHDEHDRKSEVRERVRTFGGDALAVYAADKVSKVCELRLLIVTGLPGGEVKAKFDRYRASPFAPRDPASNTSRIRTTDSHIAGARNPFPDELES